MRDDKFHLPPRTGTSPATKPAAPPSLPTQEAYDKQANETSKRLGISPHSMQKSGEDKRFVDEFGKKLDTDYTFRFEMIDSLRKQYARHPTFCKFGVRMQVGPRSILIRNPTQPAFKDKKGNTLWLVLRIEALDDKNRAEVLNALKETAWGCGSFALTVIATKLTFVATAGMSLYLSKAALYSSGYQCTMSGVKMLRRGVDLVRKQQPGTTLQFLDSPLFEWINVVADAIQVANIVNSGVVTYRAIRHPPNVLRHVRGLTPNTLQSTKVALSEKSLEAITKNMYAKVPGEARVPGRAEALARQNWAKERLATIRAQKLARSAATMHRIKLVQQTLSEAANYSSAAITLALSARTLSNSGGLLEKLRTPGAEQKAVVASVLWMDVERGPGAWPSQELCVLSRPLYGATGKVTQDLLWMYPGEAYVHWSHEPRHNPGPGAWIALVDPVASDHKRRRGQWLLVGVDQSSGLRPKPLAAGRYAARYYATRDASPVFSKTMLRVYGASIEGRLATDWEGEGVLDDHVYDIRVVGGAVHPGESSLTELVLTWCFEDERGASHHHVQNPQFVFHAFLGSCPLLADGKPVKEPDKATLSVRGAGASGRLELTKENLKAIENTSMSLFATNQARFGRMATVLWYVEVFASSSFDRVLARMEFRVKVYSQ